MTIVVAGPAKSVPLDGLTARALSLFDDPITLGENITALENIPIGSSPGNDGLPGEFYMAF